MFARFRDDNACFSTLKVAAGSAGTASVERSASVEGAASVQSAEALATAAEQVVEPTRCASTVTPAAEAMTPPVGTGSHSDISSASSASSAGVEHMARTANSALDALGSTLRGSSNDAERHLDTSPEAAYASKARLLQLPDGRVLSWSEFGHRHGYPVIYFHSPAGSRREAALLHEAAYTSGFRLIAVDRPGIGFSSFRRLRGHSELVGDIRTLLDELNILHAGLLAWAGGAAFALATARHMTERVSFVSLLAPGQPPRPPSGMLGQVAVSALRGLVYMRQGWLRRGLCAESCRSKAPRYLRRLRDRLCYADRKQIDNPLVYHLLVDDVREAGRQGARGVAQDSVMSFMEWDFDPGAVNVPVQLWQGSADTISAPCRARHLQEAMPSATLHTVARQGHFFFTQSAGDVFRAARHQLRQGREALFSGG